MTGGWHHHGSDTPTSSRAIYVLKSAKCNDIMPSVHALPAPEDIADFDFDLDSD